MPRIPIYQQQTSAQVGLRLAPMSPDVVGAPARALGALSGSIRGVASDAMQLVAFQKQQAEEKAAVWANDKAMSNRSDWVARLPQLMDGAAEDGKDFTANALKEFDAGTQESLQAAPTPASREWMRDQLGRQRLALQEEAQAFERKRGAEFKVGGIAKAADSARIAARARPQDFDVLAAEQRAAVDASGLTPAIGTELKDKSTQAIAMAATEGMIGRDPYGTLKQLNSEKPSSNAVRVLGYDEREQMRRQAESEINKREAEAKHAQAETKQALGERVRDATTAYRLGLNFDKPPTRVDFQVALGAADGNKAYESFTQEQQLGTDLQKLALLPPQEQTDLLKQRAPVGTEGVAESAERYRILAGQTQQLNKQREDDPAGYLMRYSDPVRQSFAKAAESPEAAQAYATATLAEQRRLGVKEPQILPDEVADSIAQSFYKTNNGEQLVGLIQTEQAKWGANWPQVYGQLAAKKLPPEALAIGNGMAPGASIRLANLAGLKMDDLKKGVTIAPKDIGEKIEGNMVDFQRSLEGVTGGEGTFAGMYDAVERLTYSYLRSGKGLGDATSQAFREVVGDHYAFTDFNGHTYRVPTTEDTSNVERGARFALGRIDAKDLQTPIPTSSSTAAASDKDFAAAVQKKGYWVTSANGERGLALFVDGYPVLRKDGNVYELSWDQLRSFNEAHAQAALQESVKRSTEQDATLTTDTMGLR